MRKSLVRDTFYLGSIRYKHDYIVRGPSELQAGGIVIIIQLLGNTYHQYKIGDEYRIYDPFSFIKLNDLQMLEYL